MNMTSIMDWVRNYMTPVILQSTYTCDTFLMLSGFLIGWLLMRELDKREGRVNFIRLIISRYLRLTPALIASVYFILKLLKHIGSGPLWQYVVMTRELPCRKYWPLTFTYLHNYLEGQSVNIFDKFL